MKFNNKELMKWQNKLLGILCFLLAPACLLFGSIGRATNNVGWWYSISATYYSNAKIIMIGLLITTGIIFLSYYGYENEKPNGKKDRTDRIIALITGSSAIGIAAFPCNCEGADATQILFPFIGTHVSGIIHNVCASVLFISFAVMIGTRFTISSAQSMSRKKKIRNYVYYVCASIIICFMFVQMVTSIAGIRWMTMINEFMMLTAFSVAWLVKGEAVKFLND